MSISFTKGQNGTIDMHEFFTFQDLDGTVDGEYFDADNNKLELPQPTFHIGVSLQQTKEYCARCKNIIDVGATKSMNYVLYIDQYGALMLSENSEQLEPIGPMRTLTLDEHPGAPIHMQCEGKFCVVFDQHDTLHVHIVNLEKLEEVAVKDIALTASEHQYQSIDAQNDKVGIVAVDDNS